MKKEDLVVLEALDVLETWYQVIVVYLVPLNGEEEVPIHAEGVLVVALEA